MKKLATFMALGLAACSAQSDAGEPDNVQAIPVAEVETVEFEANPETKRAQGFVESDEEYEIKIAASEVEVPSPLRPPPLFDCVGKQAQGSALLCTTEPGARVEWNGIVMNADQNGKVIIGFDRDAKPSPIEVYFADGNQLIKGIAFDNREYDISRIDGLPKNQVSEYTEEELSRIRAATARKKVGFASRQPAVSLTPSGFASPVADFIKTTNFGAQRILNGIEKRPHYGVDMAAPAGTPITAPASGYVSLAEDDMYFEGSLIMIDHGQGLISYYLHMQDVDVEAGQWVETGDQIGTVGSRGRSTGPHLCWRLKWRGQNLDPELLTAWSE